MQHSPFNTTAAYMALFSFKTPCRAAFLGPALFRPRTCPRPWGQVFNYDSFFMPSDPAILFFESLTLNTYEAACETQSLLLACKSCLRRKRIPSWVLHILPVLGSTREFPRGAPSFRVVIVHLTGRVVRYF